MLHHLPGDLPERERLLVLLDGLSAADQSLIVERADDVDGALVLVTRFIQDFQSFPAWLEACARRSTGGGAAPAPPALDDVSLPRPSARAERVVGDFTRMFGPEGSAAVGSQSSPTPSPDVPPAPAAAPPTAPAREKPNIRWRERSAEADRLERSQERPIVRWKSASSTVRPRDPGVSPPAAALPPPAPPIARPGPQPGELTRLFGPSGSGPADVAPPPVTPSPSPPLRAPSARPAEFAPMFQPVPNLGIPSPNPKEQAPSRDYLQALLKAETPLGPSTPVPVRPLVAAPAPSAPSGSVGAGAPGEFTRLMSGVVSPSPVVPPAPAAIAPAPAPAPAQARRQEASPPRSPRLPVLLVALCVVTAAAVVLVVYFAMKAP